MFLFRSHDTQKTRLIPRSVFTVLVSLTLSLRLTTVVCRAGREGEKSRQEGGEGREKNAKGKGRGRGGRVPLPLSQSFSLSTSYFFRAYHAGPHLQDSV